MYAISYLIPLVKTNHIIKPVSMGWMLIIRNIMDVRVRRMDICGIIVQSTHNLFSGQQILTSFSLPTECIHPYSKEHVPPASKLYTFTASDLSLKSCDNLYIMFSLQSQHSIMEHERIIFIKKKFPSHLYLAPKSIPWILDFLSSSDLTVKSIKWGITLLPKKVWGKSKFFWAVIQCTSND